MIYYCGKATLYFYLQNVLWSLWSPFMIFPCAFSFQSELDNEFPIIKSLIRKNFFSDHTLPVWNIYCKFEKSSFAKKNIPFKICYFDLVAEDEFPIFLCWLMNHKHSHIKMRKERSKETLMMAKMRRTWPAERTIVSGSLIEGMKFPSKLSFK